VKRIWGSIEAQEISSSSNTVGEGPHIKGSYDPQMALTYYADHRTGTFTIHTPAIAKPRITHTTPLPMVFFFLRVRTILRHSTMTSTSSQDGGPVYSCLSSV
jgi:hypothetical protein